MTITQQIFVERVKQYMENRNEITYKNIFNRMIEDPRYESMILSMTIDRLVGGSGSKKHQYLYRK